MGTETERLTELIDTFASFDRARLTRMGEAAQSAQLDARQLFEQYIEGLWQDVRRSGECPDVNDRYQALLLVRGLTRSLSTVALEALHGSTASPPPEPAR